MNLQTLSTHTVDVDLIPEAPVVLDVGCRFWGFCTDILALRPKASIFALDPDPLIEEPGIAGLIYHAIALAPGPARLAAYESYYTGEANFLTEYSSPHFQQQAAGYKAQRIMVQTMSIEDLMLAYNIEHWDVVKLDCEASEFPILENWPGPIATQISIEFHDYTHRTQWDKAYFERLFAGPLKDYQIVQHEDHWMGGGQGHWDTLIVLPDEKRPARS